MNTKSLLLDYAIPAAVMVGTGIFAYALSGGQEEFPTTDALSLEEDNIEGTDEESNSFHLHDPLLQEKLDDLLSLLGKQGETLTETKSKVDKLESTPPTWAVSLTERLEELYSEIKSNKKSEEYHCSNCQTQFIKQHTTPEEPPEPEPPKPWGRPEWLQQMRIQALRLLKVLAEEQEETLKSTGDDDMTESCNTLIMYLQNLLKHPTVPRYKRITTTNNSFKKNISPLPTHQDFLRSVGFRLNGNYFEWTWSSTNSPDSTTPVPTNENNEESDDKNPSGEDETTRLETQQKVEDTLRSLFSLVNGCSAEESEGSAEGPPEGIQPEWAVAQAVLTESIEILKARKGGAEAVRELLRLKLKEEMINGTTPHDADTELSLSAAGDKGSSGVEGGSIGGVIQKKVSFSADNSSQVMEENKPVGSQEKYSKIQKIPRTVSTNTVLTN